VIFHPKSYPNILLKRFLLALKSFEQESLKGKLKMDLDERITDLVVFFMCLFGGVALSAILIVSLAIWRFS